MNFVSLVGAGPGDGELITLKGAKRLAGCEVLIYDRLIPAELLELVPPGCELIDAGKSSSGEKTMAQEEINRILIEKAKTGRRVVRLKGGDPYIFGRGGEEAQALAQAGIAYEVIPGITSASAVPMSAGIPVTHRGISRSFHVVTGHTADGEDGEDFAILAKLSGTLVFLMGMANIERIARSLIQNGKAPDTPAAVISMGTTSKEKIVRSTLENIVKDSDGVVPPAVIVIGETAGMDMRCPFRLPLEGVRIGVVSTPAFMNNFSSCARDLGAQIVPECIMEPIPCEGAVSPEKYGWLVFTSANGVSMFMRRLLNSGYDWRGFSGVKIAAVGAQTALALTEYNLYADFVPAEYNAKALAEGLCERIQAGERVMIPRAKKGTKELVEIFDKKGIDFDEVKLYDIVPTTPSGKTVDYTVFASGAGVKAYFGQGGIPSGKVAAMGDTAKLALESEGIHVDIFVGKAGAGYVAEKILEDVSKEMDLKCAE